MKQPTLNQYRRAAAIKYHDEGTIEVDPKAKVSKAPGNPDHGAYVQAWVWVCDEDAFAAEDHPVLPTNRYNDTLPEPSAIADDIKRSDSHITQEPSIAERIHTLIEKGHVQP